MMWGKGESVKNTVGVGTSVNKEMGAGVWSGGSLQTLFTKATPALPSSSAAPWRNYLGEKEAGFKLL